MVLFSAHHLRFYVCTNFNENIFNTGFWNLPLNMECGDY